MFVVTIPTAGLCKLYQDGAPVTINGMPRTLSYKKLTSDSQVFCWSDEDGPQVSRIVGVYEVMDGMGGECVRFICCGSDCTFVMVRPVLGGGQ